MSSDRAAVEELNCDLVMKGGITSGVVYPRAISELKDRGYRFRNIAGTSAGAIAAVIAAAAEYGRQEHGSDDGFERLKRLPEKLGEKVRGKTRLMWLFQPAPRAAPLFDLAMAIQGSPSRAAILPILVLRFGAWPLLGAIPGVVFAWILLHHDPVPLDTLRGVASLVLAFGLVGIGLVAGGAYGALRKLSKAVPAHLFGLCTGNPGRPGQMDSDEPEALSPFLHRQIQECAGRSVDDPALTFAELESKGIDLKMMTSAITFGRPYLLPFEENVWFFDPAEMREILPPSVVADMEAEAHRILAEECSARSRVERRHMFPRLPLPRDGRLPILLGARMSLSFPILLSAVSLWRVDWSRKTNREAREEWLSWGKLPSGQEAWEEWSARPDYFRSDPTGAPATRLEPERVWFSDGGICSNFPVHLFDQLLPSWPTFAINLRTHDEALRKARHGVDGFSESERVDLVQTNHAGLEEEWNPLAVDPRESGTVTSFFLAILGTMQNWNDASLMKVPGYRDRIAHINLTSKEGGLNLDMGEQKIEDLGRWGQYAGDALAERFQRTAGDAEGPELSWDNHRWVRFRALMAAFQESLEGLASSFRRSGYPSQLTYEELVAVAGGTTDHPTSYRWTAKQRKLAQDTLQKVNELLELWGNAAADGVTLTDGKSPKPEPDIRLRPRL